MDDDTQRSVLGELLEHHPGMLTIDELRRRLFDVDGNIDDAVAHLVADGLANRLDQMVGASRAAVRADQLSL